MEDPEELVDLPLEYDSDHPFYSPPWQHEDVTHLFNQDQLPEGEDFNEAQQEMDANDDPDPLLSHDPSFAVHLDHSYSQPHDVVPNVPAEEASAEHVSGSLP